MTLWAKRCKCKHYLLWAMGVTFLVLVPIAVTTGWSDLARASIVPSLLAVAYVGCLIIDRRLSK
jgi:threonine/homoserine efflux transporter RhtA